MRNSPFKHAGVHTRILVASLLAAALPLIHAEAQTRFNSQPGKASVKVAGTSTFHDWEMEGHLIGGFISLDQGVEIDQAGGKINGLKDGKMPATVRAFIPVSSIHSKAEHLPDKMDELMQEYMKATDFPAILYTGKTLTLSNSAPGKPFVFNATGDLAISGVTNSVTFPVQIEQVDASHLHVTGKTTFKMTDFKIDPPAPHPLGLPTMKCGDDVTITIDWFLQKRPGS